MAAAAWDLEPRPAATRPSGGRRTTVARPRPRPRPQAEPRHRVAPAYQHRRAQPPLRTVAERRRRVQPPLRAAVYLRRRLAVVALAVTVVTVAALLLVGVWSRGGAAVTPTGVVTTPVEVVIAPGDTIWDLAHAHAPKGQNPRAYVARIVAANDVEATALAPGTVLRLP